MSCVVGVACFAGAGAARAAPDETQLAAAKQHYAAATKFFDLAEYEGILDRFSDRPEFATRLLSLKLGTSMARAAAEFWEELASPARGPAPRQPARPGPR